MPLEQGAERDIKCTCEHIRYCHVGDTGKCLACACGKFTPADEWKKQITIGSQGAD